MGIGGQRCGTTWLFHHLDRHPDIAFPAGKETHFWNGHRRVTLDEWLAGFPDRPPPVKQGEITPAYATLPADTVAKVHDAVPDVRLFFCIRNPLERAWSASVMQAARYGTDLGATADEWFLKQFRSEAWRQRGDFSGTVARWRAAFGAGQLHLILFDDLVDHPRPVLVDLARHLGVDPAPFDDPPDDDLRVAVRPASYEESALDAGRRPTLPPGLLAPLLELHRDEITRLSTLLDRDLSHWLAWDGTATATPVALKLRR